MVHPRTMRSCILIFFMVMSSILTFGTSFAVDISSCQTLSANTEYNLTANIVASADCMVFGGDNITFNGQGFSIDGTNSGEAFTANNNARANISIRNVTIIDFDEGIRLRNSRNLLFDNITFSSVRDESIRCDFTGTNEEGCYNVTFRNIISDASDRSDAIVVNRGRNITFEDITITNGGNGNNDDGILVQNSSNIDIRNVYIEFVRDVGIRFNFDTYNVSVVNVTVNDTRQGTGDGLYFNTRGNNITVENFTGVDLFGDGITFNINFSNIVLDRINLTNTRIRGIHCEGNVYYSCINLTGSNIAINTTLNDGLYIDEGRNITFDAINITNAGDATGDEAVQFARVNSTSLTNFIIDGSSSEGITTAGTSNNVKLENGTVTNTVAEGIEFPGSDYNFSIVRNVVIENVGLDGIRGANRMRHSIFENLSIINATGGDGISITTNVSNTTFRNIYVQDVNIFGIQCDDGNQVGCANSTVENIIINGTQTNDALLFDYASNISFRNISVYNIGDSTDDYALFLRGASDSSIDGFYGDNLSEGIQVNTLSPRINISNVELYNIGAGSSGLQVGANSNDKRLENITIENVTGVDGSNGYGLLISASTGGENYYKNISIINVDNDGFNINNADNGIFEDILIDGASGADPTGHQGLYVTTNSDNVTLRNINVTNSGDFGIRVDGANVTAVNIVSSNNGDDGFYKDNNDDIFTLINGTFESNVGRGLYVDNDVTNVILENIFVRNSGEDGIFLENRNYNSSLNNITINTTAGGFDGIEANAVLDSNFTNITVYGAGFNGLDIEDSTRTLLRNIVTWFSQGDGIFFDNNDNSEVYNVSSYFNLDNGLHNTGSQEVNFTLLDLRFNTNEALQLAGTHTNSRFALSYLNNAANVTSNNFGLDTFWNVTGTYGNTLGNFWDNLVCTAARIGEYLGVEYYTCVTEYYTIDVTNNRIDFGPLVEMNASNFISFENPTPLNNTLICQPTFTINTSTEGVLEKSSFIDFNRSLVAYINFENVSGTQVTDQSSYANTGTSVNSPQENRSNRIRGTYFEFSDNTSYVNLGASPELDLQSNFTVAAWIKPSSSGPADYQTIVNKEGASGFDDRNYWLSLWGAAPFGSANFRFSSSLSTTDCDINGGVDLRDDNWHHVLGQYNGTHCSLYVNGVQVGTDIVSGVPEGIGAETWIGAATSDTSRGFDGAIDEVVIMSRAMNDSEIGALYNGSVNTLYTTIESLDIGNYTYEACSINVNGTYVCTDERYLQRGNAGPSITINSPMNNSKYFSPGIVLFNITAGSVISNVSYYLNGDTSINYTMVSDDNLTWLANSSILASGNYNVTYQYDGGCGILEMVDGGSFAYILNKTVDASKQISSTSSNMYLVELSVQNYGSNTTNVTLYDYIDTPEFAFGSFTTLYSFANTTDGGVYNGTILGWNLSLAPGAVTYINYSIVSSASTDYKVANQHVFGVE